ncbi:MAG: GntR family transcriptional regulator [Proteobacteria bacterium]|nr:GntR family transcriptional regulator [Pseudomonadota bacterium]MBI3496985.1 GntR family transcriptional regulator [Pseudomonadota bacterium]
MRELGVVPIERDTVQRRVHAVLRDRLMSGAFEPGQVLKVAELAKAFGTSAMPVREALSRLVAERALESLPNRSARVPNLSPTRLRDLRNVRRAIEGMATALAVPRATADDLDTLGSILEAERDADAKDRIEASVQKNWQFHFTIYGLSGSAVLLPIIDSLWLQFGPYLRRAAMLFDNRTGEATAYHQKILAAMARGDATAARDGVEADIGRSFDLLLATAEPEPNAPVDISPAPIKAMPFGRA